MTSLDYKTLIRLVRYTTISFFVLVVGFLVLKDIVPSGKLSLSHDYTKPSPFFTEIVPKQRVENNKTILSEPVYTTLKFPRPFQSANVTVVYENKDNLFAEFGPKVSALEQYELMPLSHPLLDKIIDDSENWIPIKGGLYQKKIIDYKYSSLGQFKSNLPAQQDTGYYGVDWDTPYLPDFNDNESVKITTPVRGSHELLIATDEEVLKIDLSYYDLNKELGEDNIDMVLSDWAGEPIEEWYFNDQDLSDSSARSKKTTLSLSTSLGGSGSVYKLKITTTSDIVFNEIELNTKYIVFNNHLWIASNNDLGEDIYSQNLFSNARKWGVSATDKTSLQTIRMTHESLVIDEPYSVLNYQMPLGQRFLREDGYQILLDTGGLKIDGRGVFALNQDSYFSPLPWLVDNITDPELLDIKYIVSDYTKPVKNEAGFSQRELLIDMSEVFVPNRNMRMQLSIPDMDSTNTFTLEQIKVDYQSDPLTLSNAKEKLLRFIEREF